MLNPVLVLTGAAGNTKYDWEASACARECYISLAWKMEVTEVGRIRILCDGKLLVQFCNAEHHIWIWKEPSYSILSLLKRTLLYKMAPNDNFSTSKFAWCREQTWVRTHKKATFNCQVSLLQFGNNDAGPWKWKPSKDFHLLHELNILHTVTNVFCIKIQITASKK